MYGEDLAAIHDAGFSGLAEAAARHVVDEAAAPGVAVDLGCGGGALAESLVDAGWRVVGFDVSEAMVDLARRRVPEATLAVGDARTVDLPPCDAVTAVGEVFSYACPDRSALEAVLRRVHAALRPGGLLLFDLATPGRAVEPTRAERAGRGWRVAARTVEEDGWLTRTIDSWRTVDGVERHAREVHRQRLFAPEEVVAMLEAAGFVAVERLGGYDDWGFQEGWDGFLARRGEQAG